MTVFSTFSWPDWVEAKILGPGNEVQITVTHGHFHERFFIPRGSASRETLQTCWALKRVLIERQLKLDEITRNVTKL